MKITALRLLRKLTISVLGVPAKPGDSWTKYLPRKLLEAVVKVGVGEESFECGEIGDEVLPDSVVGLLRVGGKQAQQVYCVTLTCTSLEGRREE